MEPPEKPSENECCNNGCNPCILDVYELKLKQYQKYLRNQAINRISLKHNLISEIQFRKFIVVEAKLINSIHTMITLKYNVGNITSNESLYYRPGQYFLLRVKNQELQQFTRAYTPLPFQDIRAQSESCDTFRIIVKLYKDGKCCSMGSSIVLRSLSILLGIFFIFVGLTKLTPAISKDLHKDLRKEYVKYAKVFPLAETFDYKVPSKWYRRGVGGLEILCGLAMAAVPSHKIKNIANVSLVLLMVLAMYSHMSVGDPFDRCAPALVFFFMLSGRLVVWYQTSRREHMETPIVNGSGTSNGIKRE